MMLGIVGAQLGIVPTKSVFAIAVVLVYMPTHEHWLVAVLIAGIETAALVRTWQFASNG